MTEPSNEQPEKDLERRKKIKAVGKSAQGNNFKFPQQNHSKSCQSSSNASMVAKPRRPAHSGT